MWTLYLIQPYKTSLHNKVCPYKFILSHVISLTQPLMPIIVASPIAS